jgi:hypothetical protein
VSISMHSIALTDFPFLRPLSRLTKVRGSHYHDYRPASLVVQTTATSTPIVPPHLSPPETLEDEDNDNLLTISSLTARPLIAKSRELSKRTGVGCRLTKRKDKKAKREEARRRRRRLRKITFEPLDGSYGWVVVIGAFFVQFWVAGLVKSYGVLYVEVMERFNDSSASVASWIPAILACLCLALGKSCFAFSTITYLLLLCS